MLLIELIKEKFRTQNEETDLDKINVSSRGDVVLESEDLFDEDSEFFKLIDELNAII